jgi:uncharacterized protein YdhG (YjbR/CyaY superfamily)
MNIRIGQYKDALMSSKSGFASIDEYIATFPEDIQARLETVRATIHEAVPEAKERISYQMPSFDLEGIIIHFAAWKKHIAVYPIQDVGLPPQLIEKLNTFERTKGAIHFPHTQPLPLELIAEMAKVRAANSLSNAEAKKKAKQASKQKKA